MKRFNIFATMALAMVLGLGTAIGIGSGTKEVKNAEAALPTQLYFRWDKCSDWTKWGASASTFRVYMWNESGNNGWKTGATPTACTIGGVNYAYVNVGSYKNIIIVCYGNESKNWDSDVNKTVDIGIPTDGKYALTLGDNTSGKKSGSWDVLNRVVIDSHTASLNTGRVFVNNSGSGWNDGNMAVRCWGGSASSTAVGNRYDATIYTTTWFLDKTGDNNFWYGYVDIPLDIEGFQFVKMSGASVDADIWNYQNNDPFTLSDSIFAQVFYAVGGQQSGADINPGAAKDSKAYSGLLSHVIEAYATCNSSDKNGYGAYSSLNANFFSKAQSGQTSATVTSLGGLSKTIAEHIEGMRSRASGVNSSGRIALFKNIMDPKTTGTVAIVVISSLVAIGAFAGYFFYKKKKEDR